MKIDVVKIGGKILEDASALQLFLEEFKRVDGLKILVHGGGRSATAIAKKLEVETEMIDGRRATNRAMLDVVTMVYGGLVNKTIVSKLQAIGVNALGLTGADGGLILSHKRSPNPVDYGYVGDVDRVDSNAFLKLAKGGMVPVVAPLTHDGKGRLLNTNADTIAQEIAAALSNQATVRLIYCFEFDGVLRDPSNEESVISLINQKSFIKYQEEGVLTGGMVPKIKNALDAVKRGVSHVLITSYKDLLGKKGTTIE